MEPWFVAGFGAEFRAAYLGEKLEEEKPALSSIAFSWTFTGSASPRSPSCAVQPLPQMLQELHIPFVSN